MHRIIGYRKTGQPIFQIAGGAPNPVLDRLRDERQKQVDFMDETLARVDDEARDLVDAERANLESAQQRIAEIDAQIEPIERFEELRGASRESTSRYSPTGGDGDRTSAAARTEPRGHEYASVGHVLVDRVLTQRGDVRMGGGTNAQVSTERREAARERLIGSGLMVADGDELRAVANQTTGDTPGLLPKPIVGQIESDLDAARPFWTTQGAKDMGSIPGKSFSRPTITQHTQSGKQTSEKSQLASRKFTVAGVDFTKETHGGTLDVSRQDIDWTSPAAWNAIIGDLQNEYAVDTENAAVDGFTSAVTQTYEVPGATGAAWSDLTLQQWAGALYGAAVKAYSGNGRLPDTVYVSLDIWAAMGPVVDTARLVMPPSGNGETMGNSSPGSFAGNVLQLPRVVLPSAADGTLIVGTKRRFEVYEERIGLLQAVEPSLLGVEVAYGGYIAYGATYKNGFCKVVNAA